MTVEQLVYNIPPDLQNPFIKLDKLIWTQYLSQFDFFVSKEVWTKVDDPNYLAIVIHWKSLEQWKSIPTNELIGLSQRFDNLSMEEFGQVFKIEKSLKYNVF